MSKVDGHRGGERVKVENGSTYVCVFTIAILYEWVMTKRVSKDVLIAPVVARSIRVKS